MNEQPHEKQFTSSNLKRKNDHVVDAHIENDCVNKKQNLDNKLEGNTYTFKLNPSYNKPSGTAQSGREWINAVYLKFDTERQLYVFDEIKY